MSLVLTWLLFLSANMAQQVPIELNIDESHILSLQGSEEVVITNPAVLSHQQLPSGVVILNAQQRGASEVLIFADGELAQRLSFTVKTPLDEHLQLSLTGLQRRLPQLKIVTDNGNTIRLSGQLTQDSRSEIDDLLKKYPRIVSQIEWLPRAPAPMLVLEVRIAEVKRSFTQHIGVRWPGHLAGPLLEDRGNWLHLPLSAQATLDIMEREGQARLLATPTLTAVSGGRADFLVGGEFPVPQVTIDGMQNVDFRPYGIELEIAPRLLGDGYVHADLVAALSSIDPATAVNGIPGLLSRRVSSTLTLPLGETLILSGLLQHEQARQADRFPGLHALPILGTLFQSKQFRNAQTDLLIMVTPRLARLEREYQAQRQGFTALREEFHEVSGCVGLVEPFTTVDGGYTYDR